MVLSLLPLANRKLGRALCAGSHACRGWAPRIILNNPSAPVLAPKPSHEVFCNAMSYRPRGIPVFASWLLVSSSPVTYR